MTQQAAAPSTADAIIVHSVGKKHIDLAEITESFIILREDIEEIGKLTFEEKAAVTLFFESLLKNMGPIAEAITLSPSALPRQYRKANHATLNPAGCLTVTFEDGRQETQDLSEFQNRDLLMVVLEEFLPKFNQLTIQLAAERLKPKLKPIEPTVEIAPPPAPLPAPMPPMPEPEPLPAVAAEPPVSLPEAAPPELPEPEEPPQEVPPEVPVEPYLSPEMEAKISAISAETLEYLDMLGNEVFEQTPVSKYFDDWMVNLRQVILSFESSEVIGPDEAFSKEYNQIFGEIEDELSKRLANDADVEVSARTLVENRYLLNKIDEGYAAQNKELVAKGKSSIEYLMRNMQNLEKELAEVEATKVSYRHPLQRMAKEQKVSELNQKLNAAKKRLAMAISSSSVDKGKVGDIDAEFATQSKELEERRKIAMEFLTGNVKELQDELVELKKTKSSNPIRKVAIQQQIFETTEKLFAAKKRLELAEKSSFAEQEALRAEYEKKKQATLGKMQSLEKEITTKQADDSAEARRLAAKALTEAVKARVERRKTPPQEPPSSSEPSAAIEN